MKLEELQAIVAEAAPMMLDLSNDIDALLPETCPDRAALERICQALIGGLAARETVLNEKAQVVVMATGIFGYVMGYRAACAAPIFFVAPEDPNGH